MKILLIDVYFYRKGGVESVMFNTAELLRDNGHEVIYFALKWSENLSYNLDFYFPNSKESRKGIFSPILNLIYYFYNFEAASKLQRLIDKEKPDLAHVHLLWGQLSPSILNVLRKNKVPIVHTAHDYRIVCPAYCFKDGKGNVCEKCAGKHFYQCFKNKCAKGSFVNSFVMMMEMYFRNVFFNPSKKLDAIMYVSDFSKQIHDKYMASLKSIPNITCYNFTNIPINQVRISRDDIYFLYFGRLSVEKGLGTLLRVFQELSYAKIKIVGSGPIENELINCSSHNKMDNVEFLGYKTGVELDLLVKNAYFVILPSEWYENNPMAIIESYSFAVPVIGARIGGLSEIIQDGKTGFLFESGSLDSMKKSVLKALSLSAEEYSFFNANSFAYAESHFSSTVYYNNLSSLYQSLLKR